GGGWSPLGFTQSVVQVRCVPGKLLLALGDMGAGQFDLVNGSFTMLHTPASGETCDGIVERPDGGCSIACSRPSGAAIYDCSGGREPLDGGHLLQKMWLDATRGPMVAGADGVWSSEGGTWNVLDTPMFSVRCGAPYDGGSFTVGDGWANLPLNGSAIDEDTFAASLYEVAVEPGGTAWASGDTGLIVRRS